MTDMSGSPHGFNECAIDLDGDGTLEHLDADDEPPFIADTDEGTLEAGEGAAEDAHGVAGMES